MNRRLRTFIYDTYPLWIFVAIWAVATGAYTLYASCDEPTHSPSWRLP